MANPRQRRKSRSGTHKSVQHSRRAKTLLKKQPPIRGPQVLQDAWDPRKTVRQNYEALGLAASLNPIAAGGREGPVVSMGRGRAGIGEGSGGEKTAEEGSSYVSRKVAGANGVRQGYGKIVRDGEGNIVEVQMGEESGEGTEKGLDLVLDPGEDEELAGWVGIGLGADADADGSRRRREGQEEGAGKGVVRALERLSEEAGGRVVRHTSKGERAVLEALVGKHGDDVEGMARDRRLNASQWTAGELRRAIRKAGGLGVTV